MTLIANENYYQKKVWEMYSVDREVRAEEARKTPEEAEAELQEHHKSLERAFQHYEDKLARTVILPSPWRKWKFKKATSMALAAARYFELNVRIEADDDDGYITLVGDDIMSEAVVWRDTKQKRRLLLILDWAESVYIGAEEESGAHLIRMRLSYKLNREFIKPKR